MLKIVVPERELFDSEKEEFIFIKETQLQLEHSLISLRKWEEKYHVPFLKNDEKTGKEMLDYIKCMCISPKEIDDNVFLCLTQDDFERIFKYIQDPMTATWISDRANGSNKIKGEIITSEIIYYWMITLGIPIEFEKRHLNQLIMLIRVINAKNEKPKKMSKREAALERSRINAERRKKFNTKG